MKLYFETAKKEPDFYPLSKTKTLTKNHGRIEKREYSLTEDVEGIADKNEWCNLNAIGMVRSTRIIKDIETVEVRYFITSVTDVKLFSEAVRQHWGIENSLHWCLDMCFDEDHCRMRVDNSGESLFNILPHASFWHILPITASKMLGIRQYSCAFFLVLNKMLLKKLHMSRF